MRTDEEIREIQKEEIREAFRLKIGRDGLILTRQTINAFSDGQPLTKEVVNKIAEAVDENIQLRDWFLGGVDEFSLGIMGEFVEAILSEELLDEKYAHHFLTILSAYYMEAGENEKAFLALVESKQRKSDYSLTDLLMDICMRGGSPTMWATMRADLHKKVIANL